MVRSWIIFWTVIICLVSLIFYAIFICISSERNKLRQCADYLGYEFGKYDGTSSVIFTTKYFNETHFACCLKEKVLTEDGAILDYNCLTLLERKRK